MKILIPIIALIQFGLHLLGWIALVLGLMALGFQNFERGIELVLSGAGYLLIKYLLGIVLAFGLHLAGNDE
ncbi:MAG: hypothetical protein AAGH53_13445 [Pseudomonadota bacterium]